MSEGFEENNFFADLRERLLRCARLKIKERADAEDVAHRTIAAVIERYRKGCDVSSLVGWAFAVLQNHVADYYRCQARQREMPMSAAGDAPGQASPEDAVMNSERHARLLRAFEKLNREERQIVKGLISGAPGHELAAALRVSENAVYLRIHRLRKRLEKFMHGGKM